MSGESGAELKTAQLERESTPRLRFLEFQGFEGWEEKKLEDIAPLQRGFDLPSDQIQLGSTPVVYSNGIQKFHNMGTAKGPGLLTGRSGTIGKIHFIEQGDYWAHNTTLWVTSFKNNHPKFIYYLYSSIGMIRFASGSGVPTLNRNDVHQFRAYIPRKVEEQQKIADCLSSLETLITAESQKLEALKTHKKGLMQQLFPGEGEAVPKLRFLEFRDAGEWEDCKLSDFIETLDAGVSVNSGDRSANSDEKGILKTNAVTNGIFESRQNKLVSDQREIERLRESVKADTIIISRMNTPALVGANAYVNTNLENIFLPDRLWAAKPKPNISLKFIAFILGSDKMRSILSQSATGTSNSMKNISKSDVLSLQIFAPSPLEQRKIADCLTSLEQLISAQTQKLEMLKTHKKGLMQQLFPAPLEGQA
jgi:type I restriction enzyme S subunit